MYLLAWSPLVGVGRLQAGVGAELLLLPTALATPL